MEHNVSDKNLKEIISELLRLGYEGTYWDFKEDYTDCREDKLIDIICMANNIDGHQAYLIYGADDNGNVKGIEKTKYSRYTTKSVTEFLRSKPFAGDYIPKATVQTVEIENHELDIVIIKNTNNTPYYLTEAYSPSHDVKKKLYAGAIYTRVNDINTPRIHTANIEHTEFLWRKRFGIDLSPSQKLLHLLEHTEDWSETTWDSDRHSYNLKSPEYQIIVLDSDEGYETLSYFYDDEKMLYAPLQLKYLTTTLYETELWYMDMGRCLIPKPEIRYKIENGLFYYYIEKDSLSGKLLPFFAYGKYQCNNRSGQQIPVLIFDNSQERFEFEDWFSQNENLRDNIEKEILQNAIFQHIRAKEEKIGKSQCGVLELAIAFAYYKNWQKINNHLSRE